MSALFNPQGFLVDVNQSGITSPETYDNLLPAAGLAYNLYYGQPVTIDASTGYIAKITATTDRIFGIFAGIEFVTPSSGTLITAKRYYAANTPLSSTLVSYGSEAAYARVALYVNPQTVFRAQFSNATPGTTSAPIAALTGQPYTGQFNIDVASTTVTQLDGSIFPFAGNTNVISTYGSNFSNGTTSPVTGISYACLSPTQVTTGAVGQFILFNIVREPNNSISDSFPIVRVVMNNSTWAQPRTVQ